MTRQYDLLFATATSTRPICFILRRLTMHLIHTARLMFYSLTGKKALALGKKKYDWGLLTMVSQERNLLM